MKKHIGLPGELLGELKKAREKRGWSQARLGEAIESPQTHVSNIEKGKIIPRYDTLLEIARVLEFDLILVPRALLPAVHALIQDYQHPGGEERPLYLSEEADDEI